MIRSPKVVSMKQYYASPIAAFALAGIELLPGSELERFGQIIELPPLSGKNLPAVARCLRRAFYPLKYWHTKASSGATTAATQDS